jgi:predicted transcriptional regulator
MKSPPALSPAGFGFLISLADLHQAMTVRRHGITVMVVMAVMVAELHSFHPKGKSLRLSTARWSCPQGFHCVFKLATLGIRVRFGSVSAAHAAC